MTQISATAIETIAEPSILISAITESLHQMSLEQLKAVFNFIQSLDDLDEEYQLVDTAPEKEMNTTSDDNPLLKVAGIFSGGPGDSAEQAEEILAAEVSPIYGFGVR